MNVRFCTEHQTTLCILQDIANQVAKRQITSSVDIWKVFAQ